jgi:hypothetical protein
MGLFPYQEFVRRYMSPYTHYRFIILYHELGSGKTIAALSVAVDHYRYNKRKCIIVTKGDSATNNFLGQIEKYTNLTGYVPPAKMFTYYHYIQLSNMIKNTPEERIGDIFSDRIVIMDEVHNLKDMEEGGTLSNICKAIESSKDNKFIFSTGTPMVNSTNEIISLLSLTGRYLAPNYTIEELLYNLRGIISFSKISRNKARENIIGNRVINGKNYYTSPMKGSQLKAYKEEHERGIRNIYNPLINISLFCFPGGITGPEITSKCMTMQSKEAIYKNYQSISKKIAYKHYCIKEEYGRYLSTDKLDVMSSVYKSVIDIVTTTAQKKIFIFLEVVNGSGIVLLNSILEQQGYELYVGGMIANLTKAKRYTYCVGEKDLVPNIQDRIDGYNDELNCDGEYIQVLIGSKVIGESISLLNVKQFHFVSPHWNESCLNQAKGRVIREGSHIDKDPVVDIYLHLSTSDEIESIDEYKIGVSDQKKVEIEGIESCIQDVAIDRYVYDSDIKPVDFVSFVSLYSNLFIEDYVDRIAQYVPCSIEELLEYITDVPCKEMLVEIVRLIIVHNREIDKKYLRSSFDGLYWVSDPTKPFYGFPPLTISIANKDGDHTFDLSKFRYLPLESKINSIEDAIYNDNQAFLSHIPDVYIQEGSRYYHMLYYRTSVSNNEAYRASTYIPAVLHKKTRVFDGKDWEYIQDLETEKIIRELFMDKYSNMKLEHRKYKLFGYISVIDGGIRISREHQHADHDIKDKRKIKRGMNIKSFSISELQELLSSVKLDQGNTTTKKAIIGTIEKYILENGLYTII